MIIIWAAVRLQSPGPGIYRQPRIGQNGRLFTCLKFRTMLLSTPDRGTHEISDTAVTGLGRFLRRTKLDELPQVFNVIRNEMTFVGPRPSLPSQSEVVIERERRGVLQAKPGITGLAQINGIDMSDPVRLAEYDQRYLELQSPRLDFQIMLATLVGRGGGDRTRK
nr:sugar transferase [Devosia ginsengisoli]